MVQELQGWRQVLGSREHLCTSGAVLSLRSLPLRILLIAQLQQTK